MSPAVKPIPEGMHTVTPHLVINGAAKAIDFYKRAFDAEEIGRHPTPDGRLMHAAIKIGDSHIFLADEFPEWGSKAPAGGPSPVVLHLYVEDADKVFNQAVSAGAKSTMPIQNPFWGDRYGQVADPFGHSWSVATRIENVSPEEMKRRAEAMFSQPAAR
ncbi:MAG: VOC family protein [Acidobacteriales bacterium]|nr:VOC family protein [Terriglobales bacterium]